MAALHKRSMRRFSIGFFTVYPAAFLIHFLYYGSFLPQQSDGPLPDLRLIAGISIALFILMVVLICYKPLNTHLIDIVYIITMIHTAFLAFSAVKGTTPGVLLITRLLFLALVLCFESITDWLKKRLHASAASNRPRDY